MQSIQLRPATILDAKFLLRIKNDPTTRKFSIVTHEKIKWENHLKYLDKHLKDIYVITDGVLDYGDIRIDEEISIRLDNKYRGKGIAYEALKDVVKPGMIAKIVNGNIPSMRLFIKLGFRPIDYKENYYIFSL